MRNKKLVKYLFSPLLKAVLSNLLLVALATVLWVLLYISGCSLLSNLPTDSVAVMFYILVLWFITPILFILLWWQRFVNYQGGKVKPHNYGMLFCASFFIWSLL